MIESKKIKEILKFVNERNVDKVDLIGEPYLGHIIRVADNFDYGSYEHIVAHLHDMIEDSDCTWKELIEFDLPPEVYHALELITKKPNQTYKDYVKWIKRDEVARNVKIADIIDNLRINKNEKIEEIMRRNNKYREALKILLF